MTNPRDVKHDVVAAASSRTAKLPTTVQQPASGY